MNIQIEFDELDGMYELRRYDNFYDEENRRSLFTDIASHDDKDVLINDWIIIKTK